MNTFWVVGDRFRAFAELDGVYTVSSLVRHLTTRSWSAADEPMTIRAGQGIGRYEETYLRSIIDRRQLSDRVHLTVEVPGLATRDTVHKHRPGNVLLDAIRETGFEEFAADLRVTDDNELLLDHQTGQHVQGMIVVEAIRQMFLGVFEIGYRRHWPDREYYVVWNSSQLDFQNFLFPLPAQLTCTVGKALLEDPEKLEFEVTIGITQGGRKVATAQISFAAFDTERIKPIERRRALQALDATGSVPAAAPAGEWPAASGRPLLEAAAR